jgi:dihydropteroate synthase
MKVLRCGRFELSLSKPLIMGIVNLTDDSFSGDSLRGDILAAVAYGLSQVAAGADLLDLGAESSRPGAVPVTAAQEIERLLPVIEGLRGCGVPISVDTAKPETMRAVLVAGADMINDINALRAPGAVDAVANSDAAVCIMHMQGQPANMQSNPEYDDVVGEVAEFLAARVAELGTSGIDNSRICVDPGFGFGKTLEHNLSLLRNLGRISNFPLLVGMSRKSMLGAITGRSVDQRLAAGLAAHLLAVLNGANILRVHDVAATRDALAVFQAVEEV